MLRPFTAFGLALCSVLSLALGGCGGTPDPMDAPGTWSAHNDNDANLAAMLADPGDLQRGQDAPTGRGAAAATAIDRLLTDKTRALPSTSTYAPGGGDATGH